MDSLVPFGNEIFWGTGQGKQGFAHEKKIRKKGPDWRVVVV